MSEGVISEYLPNLFKESLAVAFGKDTNNDPLLNPLIAEATKAGDTARTSHLDLASSVANDLLHNVI